MTGEQERVDRSSAAGLLASAEQASQSMVSSINFRRTFLVAYVAIWSIGISLEHVLPGLTEFWILALTIPLALAHYFLTRKHAKIRPPLRNSGSYGWYGFLAMTVLLCLRAWAAEDLWSICAKIIVSCTVLWILLAKAQQAWDKDLVDDAREQAV